MQHFSKVVFTLTLWIQKTASTVGEHLDFSHLNSVNKNVLKMILCWWRVRLWNVSSFYQHIFICDVFYITPSTQSLFCFFNFQNPIISTGCSDNLVFKHAHDKQRKKKQDFHCSQQKWLDFCTLVFQSSVLMNLLFWSLYEVLPSNFAALGFLVCNLLGIGL